MYGFLLHLIVAVIVGWVSQRLMGYREIDFLTTLGIGLVGSYIGNLFARVLHLPYAYPGDTIQTWAGMSIPWSIAGCIVFIVAVNLIVRSANNTAES